MLLYTDIYKYLRQLSRGTYWQNVYIQAREINGIKLFDNETDFTNLQLEFLEELGYYNSILLDVSMGEVSNKVLENEIYSNAWSIYKSKKRKKLVKPLKTDAIAPKQKIDKQEIVNQNQWVFTRVKGKNG